MEEWHGWIRAWNSYLQPCVEDELKEGRLESLSASIHPSPFVSIVYQCLGLLCLLSACVCLVISLYLSLTCIIHLIPQPLYVTLDKTHHHSDKGPSSIKWGSWCQPEKVRLGIKCDTAWEIFLHITKYHTNGKDYCYLATVLSGIMFCGFLKFIYF